MVSFQESEETFDTSETANTLVSRIHVKILFIHMFTKFKATIALDRKLKQADKEIQLDVNYVQRVCAHFIFVSQNLRLSSIVEEQGTGSQVISWMTLVWQDPCPPSQQ